MICAVADDLFPRPTCQGVKVQGVKVSSLISIALLWRPRARLPPRMVFFSRKDPRIAPRYLTAAIASGAAVIERRPRAKKVLGICGNSREVAPRSPLADPGVLIPPPPKNSRT
jgi:hypothetical protein